MAKVALALLMRTGERKFGLLVMIETPKCPAIGIMTLNAIFPETGLVIAVFMTSQAFRRCVLEGLCLVTFLAKRNAVQANQREMR